DARLEQDLCRVDVVDRVDLEIGAPALANAGLRGQMKDVRDVLEQRRQIRVGDGALDESESLARCVLREVRLFDRTRVIVGEAVEAAPRGAPVEERRREVRADEAGGAGDQRFHTNVSRTRLGSRHGLPEGSSAACTVRPVADTTASDLRTTW